MLVRPRFEPTASRSADRRSPNWANRAAVIAAVSALGIVPSGIEGLPSTADLFDIGAAGAEGTELEGILQNLSGVSHLPPDIVPGGSALDFDTGLGMW